MALEELYREVILDHYRNARNKGHLDHPEATAQGVNPLCGDEINIEISFEADKVSEVAVSGMPSTELSSPKSPLPGAVGGSTSPTWIPLSIGTPPRVPRSAPATSKVHPWGKLFP